MSAVDHNAERVLKELRRYGMTRETYRYLTAKEPCDQVAMAVSYARWLAARDGKKIPPKCGAKAIRAGDRIRAVDFQISKRRHVTIPIPHWDWTPTLEKSA
jgi:hypothetical protein